MYHTTKKKVLLYAMAIVPFLLYAQSTKILTNHVGYEYNTTKQAIIVSPQKNTITSFNLVDANNKKVFKGSVKYAGLVDKWKNWQFWTIDFSAYQGKGEYTLEVLSGKNLIKSYPFVIGDNILEQKTISDVIYYFKGQRSSGLNDKADHSLFLAGKRSATDTPIDVHGGWYDATGDYSKILSHLPAAVYFNPQQNPFTAWALFQAYNMLAQKSGTNFKQINRRILDEAMYGADYLMRVHVKNNSFYREIAAPGKYKLPQDRFIQSAYKHHVVKKSPDDISFNSERNAADWKSYQVSYRTGGGMGIAALALASSYPTSGDYTNAEYLAVAEEVFAFLEKENLTMNYDGKENIIDDYCALTAATELYKATKKEIYKNAAKKRAQQLINRLASWKQYNNYWRADDQDRPFFHPADAGFPVVSLANYYPYVNAEEQALIKKTIKASMDFELNITNEVNNPFGYSRQLVQDTLGKRKSAFFFPQVTEASPWWQGENARIASMATAARVTAKLFQEDTLFQKKLEKYASNQINWILGLNPFDACMLQGSGHNNPAYGYFGTFEYMNAPGGIVNGITAGLNDESDIDFNLPYSLTGKDYDWRWAEQWIPHTSWYLLSLANQ